MSNMCDASFDSDLQVTMQTRLTNIHILNTIILIEQKYGNKKYIHNNKSALNAEKW